MITKQDVLLLLARLKDENIDCSSYVTETVKDGVNIDTLKFINDNRQLELSKFYEKLRKSNNEKKSRLYSQIMKDYTEEDVYDIICALNSYALQVCIFARDIEDKPMFFRFSRLNEIYKCLENYSRTYNIVNCMKLLHYIKSDIKVLEMCYRE